MKTKMMVVAMTMLFALAMMAQTATQGAPAAPAAGDKCPMMKDGKMANGKGCCGDGCCKDGKCDMAAHKSHTMTNGKSCHGEDCCKDGKCNMADNKEGKAGCCGDKCPMMKGGKPAATKSHGCCRSVAEVSCCRTGAACCA